METSNYYVVRRERRGTSEWLLFPFLRRQISLDLLAGRQRAEIGSRDEKCVSSSLLLVIFNCKHSICSLNSTNYPQTLTSS